MYRAQPLSMARQRLIGRSVRDKKPLLTGYSARFVARHNLEKLCNDMIGRTPLCSPFGATTHSPHTWLLLLLEVLGCSVRGSLSFGESFNTLGQTRALPRLGITVIPRLGESVPPPAASRSNTKRYSRFSPPPPLSPDDEECKHGATDNIGPLHIVGVQPWNQHGTPALSQGCAHQTSKLLFALLYIVSNSQKLGRFTGSWGKLRTLQKIVILTGSIWIRPRMISRAKFMNFEKNAKFAKFDRSSRSFRSSRSSLNFSVEL